MARLIYTDFSNYGVIKELFKGKEVTFVYDENDSDKLRDMKVNEVFITSEEAHMRAYDYRSKLDSGIALYIDSPLSCKRTLIQALGRVGRYAQRCKRFIRSDIDPVSPEKNAMIKKIIAKKIEKKVEEVDQRKRDKKILFKTDTRITRAAKKAVSNQKQAKLFFN